MPGPRSRKNASLHRAAPSNVDKNTPPALPTEAVIQPQIHPMVEFKEDPRVQNIEVICNCCLLKVTGKDALGHLFFGILKCANCLYVIKRCEDFQNNYPVKERCSKTRKIHAMTKWEIPAWNNYLIYCARRNCIISNLCENDKSSASQNEIHSIIMSYLESLVSMKNMLPWKLAFTDPLVKKNMERSIMISMKSKPQQALAKNVDQNKQAPAKSKDQNIPQEALAKNRQQIKPVSSITSDDKPSGDSKTKRSITTLLTTAEETQEAQNLKHINGKGKKPVGDNVKPVGALRETTPKNLNIQQKGGKEEQKAIPSSSLVAQTHELELQGTEVQQRQTRGTKQDNTPLTSSAVHVTPKSSPQKRRVMQERQTTRARRTTLQKVKIEEKEKSNIKCIDIPAAPQTPEKSSPQKRKTQQSRTKDASRDTTNTVSTNSLALTKRTFRLIEEKSSDLSPAKRERKLAKESNTPYSDIIPKEVLRSENYLVVQFPQQQCPEECPNCYCPFSPKMCNVNLSTLVTNFRCPNCKLAVYVVPEKLYNKPT